MSFPTLNYLAILPLLILVIAAALVLLADLVVRNKRVLTFLGLLAVAAALAAVLLVRPATPEFPGHDATDELGLFAAAASPWPRPGAAGVERTADFTQARRLCRCCCWHRRHDRHGEGQRLHHHLPGPEIFSLALYILVGFARRCGRAKPR